MSNDLKKSMQTLRALAPRLNQITDQAADTVRKVEEFLHSHGVGEVAYAKMSEDHDGSGPEGKYIGFLRHGPKFRVVVLDADDDGNDRNVRLWSECPREEKLDAFDHLPELLNNICLSLKSRLDKTVATVEVVKEVLSALDQK